VGGLIALSWRLTLKKRTIWRDQYVFIGPGKKIGYKNNANLIPNGVDIQLFSKDITPKKEKKYGTRFRWMPAISRWLHHPD